MNAIVRLLSRAVRRFPAVTVIVAIVLTVALGGFISQQQMARGNEGFAPDAPEFVALNTIDEYFSDNSQVAVQVVVSSEQGDLITAEGLQAYVAAVEAVQSSEAGARLAELPQGAIQGYFGPLLQGLAAQGVAPSGLSDADVKQGFLQSLGQLPPEFAEQFTGLLSSKNTNLDVPSSSAGLIVVFLNASGISEEDLQAVEIDMAQQVREASTDDITVAPFSFALLFEDEDTFQREIGRLFATAFAIIMVLLGFVYWIHPRGRMTARASLRRAVADVLLTLVTIMMAIGWMQGIGVLLGPGYLGWIGAFNELLQILPVLLIGLGVDYAIHLNSRYREELGAGEKVARGAGRATATVGVALVLATVTTSVGFLTNIANPVPALKDFGILAAIGIVSAFLLMLTFLPAVRLLLDRRAEKGARLPVEGFGHSSERLLPTIMGKAAVFAEHVPIATLMVTLLLAAAGIYGVTRLDTKFSFTDFVPEGSELLVTFDTIQEEFAGGFGERTDVLIEGDVATPAVHNALVEAWGNMADTENVVTFADRALAESPVSVIAQLIQPPDQGGSPEVFDPAFAQFALASGLQTPDLTVAAGTDVAGLYRGALEAAPGPMQRVLAEGPDGTFRFIDMSVSTQAGDGAARQLSTDLQEDLQPLNTLDGVTAVATNQNIVSEVVVTSLQESQLSSLAITLLAAMLLLVVVFWIEAGRPMLGVITILPVALVVLWTFGMMALTGIPFGPVTATIAALAIGIGVPYTIHITHRYQEDRERFDDPEEAIRSTTRHTGGALAGSAFTTVAGFGILVTSSLTPFQQFGAVTVYAIGFALIASVLVLPSMLVLWDRWHLRRGEAVVEHRPPALVD